MSAPVVADDRKRKLAAIHAAAAKAGMDTADRSVSSVYRTMLQAQGGVTSAADLDAPGRQRVLAYLLRLANPEGTRPRGGWQVAKIEQLWRELGALAALRDPSLQGLDAFVKTSQRVASRMWLDGRQGAQVIEALKAWKQRVSSG